MRLILSLALLACLSAAPGVRAQDATAGALDKLSLDALTARPAPGAMAAWNASHPSPRRVSVRQASARSWSAPRHYAVVSHPSRHYAAAWHGGRHYAAVSHAPRHYAVASRSRHASVRYASASRHYVAPRHSYAMASWSHASWTHRPQTHFVAAWTRVPSHASHAPSHAHHVRYVAPKHHARHH